MCDACTDVIRVMAESMVPLVDGVVAFDGELETGVLGDVNVEWREGAVGRWLYEGMCTGAPHSLREVLIEGLGTNNEFGVLEGVLCMPDHVVSGAQRLRLMRAQVVSGRDYLTYGPLAYGQGNAIDMQTYEFVHGVFDVANHAWEGGVAPPAGEQDEILAAIQAVYDSHVPRMIEFAKELVLRDVDNKYAWGYLHLVGGIRTYVDVRGVTIDVEGMAMQHFDASYARSAFGRTYWTPHLHMASATLVETSRGRAILDRLGRVPPGANRVFGVLMAGAQRLSDSGVLPAQLGDVEVWHAILSLLDVCDLREM
jgi:hypothetical protein